MLIVCLVHFSENLKIVNLQGRLKSNKKLASELSFEFCIGSVGKCVNTPGPTQHMNYDTFTL